MEWEAVSADLGLKVASCYNVCDWVGKAVPFREIIMGVEKETVGIDSSVIIVVVGRQIVTNCGKSTGQSKKHGRDAVGKVWCVKRERVREVRDKSFPVAFVHQVESIAKRCSIGEVEKLLKEGFSPHYVLWVVESIQPRDGVRSILELLCAPLSSPRAKRSALEQDIVRKREWVSSELGFVVL